MSGQLQRLVLDFRTGELVVRCLYRSSSGPGPGTKARRREVAALTRSGLTQALEALEGGRTWIWSARRDSLPAKISSVSPAPMSLEKLTRSEPREGFSFLSDTANYSFVVERREERVWV